MYKGITFRLYPNQEQSHAINQTIGNARKMYNLMLGEADNQFKQFGKSTIVQPTFFKGMEEFSYLKETDSLAYANERIHLQSAYQNFFRSYKKTGKYVGFPKFKSKRTDKWSYTTNNQKGSIRIEGKRITLPKIGAVRFTQHRKLPEGCSYSSVTVFKTRTNKYFVTLCCTYEQDIPTIALNPEVSLGLDYSSPKLYVDNQDNSPLNPHLYREYEQQLAIAQRKLSRKVKGSNNYMKAKLRVAKIHEKISNSRTDFLWKLAVEIASREDVHYVFVEDLDMQDIAERTPEMKLGKSTYDNGWGSFLLKLEWELTQRGKRLVKVGRFFPSSQKCSKCGIIHPEMKDLSIRVMKCSCGLILDRDVNAAVNIRNEGIRIVLAESNSDKSEIVKNLTKSNRRNCGVCLTE